MNLKDPEGWGQCLVANPLPEGFSPDPNTWPDEPTTEQMGDLYGAIVVIAAVRWAEKMEQTLADAESLRIVDSAGNTVAKPPITIAEIAADCFTVIERDLGQWGGLTGFQYGAVVATLAQVWEHGDELRRWHNLDIQIGDEGERANETGVTLNPALLTIHDEAE